MVFHQPPRNRLATNLTDNGPGPTSAHMVIINELGHNIVTKSTQDHLRPTSLAMSFNFPCLEHDPTRVTLATRMILLRMFLVIVDIVGVRAFWAFADVAPAVAEMGGVF